MWYIVQWGDTVPLISRRYGVPVETIVHVNSIYGGVIYVGQWIYIPRHVESIRSQIQPTVQPGQPIDSTRKQIQHTVQPGETLDSIALKYNTTKQIIMQQNNLTTDQLELYQTLKIDLRTNSVFQSIPSGSSTAGPPKTNGHVPNVTKQPQASISKQENSSSPLSESTYVVKIGDTLDTISAKIGIPKSTLIELNKLGKETITAGESLIVKPNGIMRLQPRISKGHSHLPTPYKIEYRNVYDVGLQAPIKIWKDSNGNGLSGGDHPGPIFFVSKMAVTAAGAHKAYHQDSNVALDFLSTAGFEGYWWGIATDNSGKSLVQGNQDPAEGYYISKTALSNCNLPLSDPSRYLDALVIPYITLPALHMLSTKLGDPCVVINTNNNEWSYAIIGDIWPESSVGIGSIALARNLKIPPSPKSGGTEDGILYIVFPREVMAYVPLRQLNK